MNKTLKELGEDYLANVTIKEEQIKDCSIRLKEASRKNNLDEIYRLRTLLKLFYIQKNDLLENANILINYYI